MPIFMQWAGGNIKGDVTADGYEGWIELNSVNWGKARSVSNSRSRGDAAPPLREIVVTKASDSSSFYLRRESLQGQPVTVEIDLLKPDDNLTIYLKITMDHVLISNYTVSDAVEAISLNFDHISWSTTATTASHDDSPPPLPAAAYGAW